MIPGTLVGDTIALHENYVINKAGTRIRCLGGDCGLILDVVPGPAAESLNETFTRHLVEILAPVTDRLEVAGDPPF